jgi:hypothetical protein
MKHIYLATASLFLIPLLSSAQNNDCSGAITLTPGTSCTITSGSTSGFTQSNAAISCNSTTGNADDDGWYRFVAATTENRIDVWGIGGFDPVIDVRQGSCPGTSILCAGT